MKIRPLKQQYACTDTITENRIRTIMPKLMQECGIDMWIILASEYNEDPVFKTIVPSLMKNASRLTCIVFSLDKTGHYEAVSINKANKNLAAFYKQIPYSEDTQWETLKHYILEKNPDKIGLNLSSQSGLTSGLSHGLFTLFSEKMGREITEKTLSAEKLCIRWLEQRTEEEMALYPEIYKITAEIMEEAFSRNLIVPGTTTTEDVEFWASERFMLLGLPLSFPLTVNLQRKGNPHSMITGIIQEGDLLHYDAGIEYLGLCTDLQRLAYVLPKGETEVPQGITAGFSAGRKLGNIIASEFIEGRTGNEIFQKALSKGQSAGYEMMLYSHPIGKHCHGAGPTIGLYDKQAFIPLRGENKLHKNTAYALEYNLKTKVPEWDNQHVFFYLEETVLFQKNAQIEYLDNAYKKLIVI